MEHMNPQTRVLRRLSDLEVAQWFVDRPSGDCCTEPRIVCGCFLTRVVGGTCAPTFARLQRAREFIASMEVAEWNR